jgi:hypothetical protein
MRFQVSEECIANLLRVGGQKFVVSKSQCPSDASFVRSMYDPISSSYWCVMEHFSFEPVPEGSLIPESTDCVVVTACQ